MTGGMDNPVDVAFTPSASGSSRRRSCEHPQAGKRDAIVHAIYGGVYGKDARGHRRPQAHRRSDAGADAPRPRRAGRPDALRIARVRRRLPRQLLRGDVQPAQGHAARARSRAARRSRSQSSDFVVSTDRDFHPDRRDRGRRRQPARGRHGRLVQALLPDVAAREARRARRHLPGPPHRRAASAGPAWPAARLAGHAAGAGGEAAWRSAPGGARSVRSHRLPRWGPAPCRRWRRCCARPRPRTRGAPPCGR